ncbi:MAG TPA: class I SAM-dependent methyltransferase [Candidatus Polarisedimenticolia bacterium]|nr:class I SAM-dependent methyltransferase [Candidatus Polarisedimenticolia bacterium]
MSQRHDAYRGFADHYDLHGWDWYAPTYGPRLFRLVEEKGLAGCRVLDAGCGTGTLALELAQRGYRVAGMDLSEAMIAVARRKDSAGKVAWRVGDITTAGPAPGDGPYDLVTCVADILNHLESLDLWEQAFRRLGAHLRSGGWLFFDVMTCRGLERLDKFVAEEKDGRMLIASMIYEPATRRSTVKVTSFAERPGTHLYERACETITEWGQPISGILERLGAAGFHSFEQPFAMFDDPEKDDRLGLLAQRR